MRRDVTEQGGLVAQHREIRDRLTAIGDHHRQIDQHPPPVMTALALLRCRHRRRQLDIFSVLCCIDELVKGRSDFARIVPTLPLTLFEQ
jgi:hypothetical protein